MKKQPLQPETLAIRLQQPQTPAREHSVPAYLTSSFTFESAEQARAMFADELPGYLYSRYSNPNTTELVEKLCALEGADGGIAFAARPSHPPVLASFQSHCLHSPSRNARACSAVISKYLRFW